MNLLILGSESDTISVPHPSDKNTRFLEGVKLEDTLIITGDSDTIYDCTFVNCLITLSKDVLVTECVFKDNYADRLFVFGSGCRIQGCFLQKNLLEAKTLSWENQYYGKEW